VSTTQGYQAVTTVRDWAGRVLVELERADISKLTATG
jgi:dipeptidyl-peptidase-4